MHLNILDFNLRKIVQNDATATYFRSEKRPNQTHVKSITLTDERSVLMKKWCSADRTRGSTERSRSASNGRAVALSGNLIAIPRAGFTTATTRRYRSPFSSVHAKEKNPWDLATQYHNTNHRMEKKREEDVSVFVCFPGRLQNFL